jgi:uncharacterized protein
LRIILDTNVFVSGILFGGKPNEIVKAFGAGKLDLVISPAILDEYIRVAEELAHKKGVDITQFIQMVAVRSTIWNAPKLTKTVCTDPDDDKFLECALYSGTKLIISGDKALIATSGYKGIAVITPAEFVKKYPRP